jgi:hypothetical protein
MSDIDEVMQSTISIAWRNAIVECVDRGPVAKMNTLIQIISAYIGYRKWQFFSPKPVNMRKEKDDIIEFYTRGNGRHVDIADVAYGHIPIHMDLFPCSDWSSCII